MIRIYQIRGKGIACTCIDGTGEPPEQAIEALRRQFGHYELEYVGERQKPQLKGRGAEGGCDA